MAIDKSEWITNIKVTLNDYEFGFIVSGLQDIQNDFNKRMQEALAGGYLDQAAEYEEDLQILKELRDKLDAALKLAETEGN